MRTGAVIVAAGMPAGEKSFDPLLTLGSISIAQRVVATFRQAGIEKIVMVTGFQAEAVERHMARYGLIFLRNEDFVRTKMFDSARIGLSYIRDKCDRVLFTPVDIPLFTAATVNALLETEAALACPVCGGKRGHPLLLSTGLIGRLLEDSGEGGLQGALERCGTPITEVEVPDRGVLHEADAQEDTRALLLRHNEQMVRPVIDISLAKEKPFFESRAAMLLGLIRETGSVRTACQLMQMSYSSGWNVIRRLETELNRPLVSRSQGGAGGSSSSLTEEGERLLSRYEDYAQAVREQAARLFWNFFRDFF